MGGVSDLAASDVDTFEPIYSSVQDTVLAAHGPIRLAFASIGALILTVPISWAYFITSRARRIDQSFLQTIMILPVVVTGISMIVLNSLALGVQPRGRCRCRPFSLFAGSTFGCHVHFRRNCHRARLRYWCAWRRDGYILCVRFRDAIHLETGIWQDIVRAISDDADAAGCRRGRLRMTWQRDD